MLQLDRFLDLAGFEALYADTDLHGRAVYYGPDGLQIRKKYARVHAGYLLADAAFFLCQAAPLNGSSGNRFFTADRADF